MERKVQQAQEPWLLPIGQADIHKTAQPGWEHSREHSVSHRSLGTSESRQSAEQEEGIDRNQAQRLVSVVELEQGDCHTLD